MSRDVLTVGSTMRIPLLYQGEYSQWAERFMNYLEEQMDGEAMINSIKNGDHPLPRVTQVSIAGTSSTEQPHLKDKSMWSDQEKKIQKIDRLARSLLIQGLSNDIYFLVDSNKTAKDLWDALARHMLGFEYVINDLKKCGYSKDNCELNLKFLNNLQPEWKQYATLTRQNKNLMDINIDALYNILKQNLGDVNDAMRLKKKTVVVTSDPLALIAEKTKAFNRRKFYYKPTNNNLRTSSTYQSANKKQKFVKTDNKKVKKKDDEKKRDMSKVKCYNCKKEGNFTKDCKKVEVKDYEYYKTKMLLAKKDKDEQVLLAEDQAWMESSNDSDQEINAKTVFMAQIEKVFSDSETSSSSADDKISEEGCVSNKDVEIKKCLERLNECENKLHKIGQTNQSIHMIMPSKDTLYNGRKGIGFENPSYFKKSKDLRPSLYDEKVIGLGYTPMFLIYSDEALEIKKFKRARENRIEFAYDYGNLNASYQTSSLKPYVSTVILEKIIIDLENEVVNLLEKEKANLKTIESLKSKGFESSENTISESENQSENDCHVVEKQCDQMENSKLIALGMFKLNSEGSSSDGFSKLKKITALLAKAFNQRKFYSKPTNNNLRTSSSSQSANKKQEFVKTGGKKEDKKADKKKRDMSKVKYQAWMESSSDSDQEINANMVFMAQIEKVLSDSEASSSSADEKISEIVQICLWIIDSGCSKHMTGNRAL
nr:hypothetical protein [Tanacetum cinerariifolium]